LPRPLSRRTVLRGATAFAATAAFAAYAKRARPSGAHFDTTQVRLALPSIGPSHHGVSVAQLSDLHLGEHSTPDARVLQALAAVASADVDLLVLTGDFLTWSKKPLERFESLLRDRGSQPTIAVLGNHDHRVDEAGVRRTLERLGITARAQAVARRMTGAALTAHIGAHRRLTHPEEMGKLFKALALHPRRAPPPPGF
jgi:predicted MPP superfamily phosphohydrolase